MSDDAPTPPEPPPPAPPERPEVARPRRSLLGRALRALGAMVLWALAALLCLVVSVVLHSRTDRTLSVARVLIERLASDALRGDLEIGRLEQLDADRIVAHEVVIRDPQGRAVIRAQRLVVWPSYRDILFRGVIRTQGARIENGEVELYVSGDEGETISLVEAFEPAEPSPDTGGPASAIPILLEGLRIVDTDVRGDLPGYPGLRAEDVQAQGSIVIADTVQFHVDHLEGRMTGPYPGETHIDHAVVHFDTDWRHGLQAYARAHRGEDQVRARISLTRPGSPPPELPGPQDAPLHMDLEAHTDRLSLATLAEMGIPGTASLGGRVRGDARLSGPVEDLELHASLVHDAGPLVVRGRLASDSDLVFEGETRDFDLQALVPAAPPIAVGGAVRVDVARDPDAPQRARFRVRAEPLVVAELDVPAFDAEGAIEDDAVMIDRAEARLPSGVLTARGRVGFDGSLDVHARLDVGDVSGVPNVGRFVPGLRGGAAGALDLETGPGGSDLVLSTDLHLRDFRYGPVYASRLVVHGRARGDLSRPIVRFDAEGEGVAISGQTFGTARAHLEGGPSSYELEWASQGGDVRRLQVRAHARREGETWVAEVPDVALDVGLGAMTGAIAQLRIGPRTVRIVGADIAGNGQRLEAEATLHLEGGPSQAVVTVEGLSLERVGGLVGGIAADLQGTAEARLTLEGPLRDPVVRLRGRVDDMSWDRVRNADIAYDLSYRDGVLTTLLTGELGTRGSLGIEGPIRVPFAALLDPDRFVREAQLGLHVYAGHLNLAFLTPFLGEEMQALGITGRIGGDVLIEGSVDEPRVDLGVIVFDRLALPGWSELRAKIHFALGDDELRIERLWIADLSGELAMAEARLPISLDDPPDGLPAFLRALGRRPWSVGARLSPRLLETWPRPLQRWVPPGVVGALALTAGGGDGSPARAELTSSFEWVEAPTDEPCARSLRPVVQLHGSLDNGVARLDASGFTEGRMVAFARAEAEAPVDTWLSTGSIQLPRPDLVVQLLEMPLQHVPWVCARASGIATAEVTLRDVLSAAPELDARLEITNLVVQHGRDERAARGTNPYHVVGSARIVHAEADARAEACFITANQGQLVTPFVACRAAMLPEQTEAILRASVPLRFTEGEPLPELLFDRDLDIAMLMADAHLEPLLALLPQLAESDVLADGRIVAHGPWDAVELSGGVSLRDGRLRVVPLGQELTDVRGALQLAGDRILIPASDPLSARDGEGSVRISGELGMQGLLPSHAYLDVRPDQFPVRREGAVLATLTGHADTRVTIGLDGMEGAVEISDVTVRLPEQLAGSVQPLDAHSDVLVVGSIAPEAMLAAGPPYPVHLFVDARRPFWVRRNDFAVQVSAELDVRYLDPNLYIGGVATLERGYFEVFGKRFEVQRGSLVFGGTEELDPQVDLVAVYALAGSSGSSITVAASGTLSNLSIDFSSTETDDQGEIIALLVSGRSALATDASGSGRDATQVATEQAARVVTGIAAGILTLGLREQFGDAFPLIAIETGANLGDTRIRAGFNADAIIPDFMREVVLGAYVEGFVTTSGGAQGSGTGGVGGGVSVELQFPYDLVGSGTYVPPTSWGVDLVWEP